MAENNFNKVPKQKNPDNKANGPRPVDKKADSREKNNQDPVEVTKKVQKLREEKSKKINDLKIEYDSLDSGDRRRDEILNKINKTEEEYNKKISDLGQEYKKNTTEKTGTQKKENSTKNTNEKINDVQSILKKSISAKNKEVPKEILENLKSILKNIKEIDDENFADLFHGLSLDARNELRKDIIGKALNQVKNTYGEQSFNAEGEELEKLKKAIKENIETLVSLEVTKSKTNTVDSLGKQYEQSDINKAKDVFQQKKTEEGKNKNYRFLDKLKFAGKNAAIGAFKSYTVVTGPIIEGKKWHKEDVLFNNQIKHFSESIAVGRINSRSKESYEKELNKFIKAENEKEIVAEDNKTTTYNVNDDLKRWEKEKEQRRVKRERAIEIKKDQLVGQGEEKKLKRIKRLKELHEKAFIKNPERYEKHLHKYNLINKEILGRARAQFTGKDARKVDSKKNIDKNGVTINNDLSNYQFIKNLVEDTQKTFEDRGKARRAFKKELASTAIMATAIALSGGFFSGIAYSSPFKMIPNIIASNEEKDIKKGIPSLRKEAYDLAKSIQIKRKKIR